jgi:hypothetical protein
MVLQSVEETAPASKICSVVMGLYVQILKHPPLSITTLVRVWRTLLLPNMKNHIVPEKSMRFHLNEKLGTMAHVCHPRYAGG